MMTSAVATTMACSTEEEKNAGWECERVDVPMGEVTRCTAASRVSDGKATPSFGGTAGSGTGGGSTQIRTYGAPPASSARRRAHLEVHQGHQWQQGLRDGTDLRAGHARIRVRRLRARQRAR